MIAQVLVDVKSKNVNKTYDYLVPESFRDFIELGSRVVVEFGNRKVMGFILGIKTESDYDKELKPLTSVLDLESYLTEELITIARNLAEQTNTLIINALQTILPSSLKVIYKPRIKVLNFENLTDDLKEIFKYQKQLLLEHK
jgi:primosomal protein N' (replication factor Y)